MAFTKNLTVTSAVGLICLTALSTPTVHATGVEPSATKSTPDGPYLLMPDDSMDIIVSGHDELKATLTILPDGTVSYPGVGTIQAAGKTVAQLTIVLEKGVSKLVNDPDVTIIPHLGSYHKVNVLGAVRNAGQYDVAGEMRVLGALSVAGGLTQDPTQTDATLISTDGHTTEVDIPKLMVNGDQSQNFALNPGDILLVHSSTLQAQVSGAVTKPGSYSVPAGGASVLTLLDDAGGATNDAALTKVQILHDGNVQIVNAKTLSSNLQSTVDGPKVMPGDAVMVSNVVDKYAVLGEVRTPGAYAIPDGGSVTATAALVQAGGPVSDADKRKANLLRQGPDGKAIVIPLDIDAVMEGRSQAGNTPLQPGDIIYVPNKNIKEGGINPLALLLPGVELFRR